MRGVINNLSGKTFGKLRVISRAKNIGSGAAWKCKCSCKKVKIILGARLISGNTKSCGCLRFKHGKSKYGPFAEKYKKEYVAWQSLRQRCDNPKDVQYKDYGRRGIHYCKKWNSFKEFFKDLGKSPSGYYLDRIDNSKGYTKKNCRWCSPQDSGNNRRSCRYFTYKSKKMSAKNWSRKLGIIYSTIIQRYKRGWSVEQILKV